VREGKLISAETVSIPLLEKTNWDEAFRQYVDQYYTTCEDIAVPSEVVLQHSLEDQEALQELLNSKANGSVKITVPKRGGKTDLIALAEKNAAQVLEHELIIRTEDEAKHQRALTTLQEELAVNKLPRRIECFDISNIQGTDNVASMVVFENATAKKSDYRLFKIRSVEGEANDFKSMKEVVTRRYSKLLQENKPFPDLIIIDGGKGQLNAACEALTEIGVTEQDIIGLAKKQEEVYKPGSSTAILLPRRSDALHLLQRARDEAHRFAVTYHRKLRAKRSITSNLDLMPGVGKARRKLLLDHFGNFDAIKQASLEELSAVRGIPKPLAEKIFYAVRGAKVPERLAPAPEETASRVAESPGTTESQ
jgi:excinuclease ABC subunit C